MDKGESPCVFRLCFTFGKNVCPAEAAERWEGQLIVFQSTVSNHELFGLDGEPIEIEWNILPGVTSLEMLRKIKDDLQRRNIQP